MKKRSSRKPVSRRRAKQGESVRIGKLWARIRDLGDQLVIEREAADAAQRKLLDTELQLAEAKERYADLFDFASIGYANLDRSGIIRDINLIGAAMLGLKRESILKTPLLHWVARSDRREFLKHLSHCRMSAPGVRTETEMQFRDAAGKTLFVRLISKSSRGSLRTALLDVTEQREARELLKKSEANLHEVNRNLENRVIERTASILKQSDELRKMAAELASTEQRERKNLSQILHDNIQQLLVAAIMQLERLKRQTAEQESEAATEKTQGILREALAACRTMAVELCPPALNQAGLVAGLRWLAGQMLERNSFIVHLKLDDTAEPEEEETRFLLYNCARELLLNALKHSGVAEASVTLKSLDKDSIKLIISDKGKGSALKPNAKTDRIETLGMFSIKQRLAHAGGEMKIVSAPDKGMMVALIVPAKHGKRIEPPTAKLPEKTISVRRILVADDRDIARHELCARLQLETDMLVIAEACDGAEAVEMAGRLKPDVVIMDVNIGVISGADVTRRIIADNPQTRVLALSNHADETDKTLMRKAGVVGLLPKDGPLDALLTAIRNAANA